LTMSDKLGLLVRLGIWKWYRNWSCNLSACTFKFLELWHGR